MQATNAHRNLKNVGRTSVKSSQRLSSGKRINSAADDAAGLAISEKMRAQIRGLDRASQNAIDGISLIQTAEGALQEVSEMLQRMRELVVQAANDTNTPDDRENIAQEVVQLKEQIDAIGEMTQFNGKNVFDKGTLQTLTYEITVQYPAVAYQPAVPAQDVYASAADVHDAYTIPGYTIPARIIPSEWVEPVPAQLVHLADDLVIMTDYTPGYWTAEQVVPAQTVPDKYVPAVVLGQYLYTIPAKPEVQARDAYEAKYSGTYTDLVETQIYLQLGANANEGFEFLIGELSCAKLGLNSLHPMDHPIYDFPITQGDGWNPSLHLDGTQGGWDDGLKQMDEAISRVSEKRAYLGAVQNRLAYTTMSLDISSENLSAANSRIADADMAKEMMEFTKSNVLQQAGIAMLAQANQTSQAVLQLIR